MGLGGGSLTRYGVVGNRDGWDFEFVLARLDELIKNEGDVVISGGAVGVDSYAHHFARAEGLTMVIHYPDYRKPSPQRYFDRNLGIARDCDVLVAFDKKSGRSGTKNTVSYARKLGKRVILFKDEEGVRRG